MPKPFDQPCETCDGRRFVRTPQGWINCTTCYIALVNHVYIKPPVKEGESSVPPGGDPWPLTDRLETGDYSSFRRQVWRSLLHYDSQRLSYEYVDGWRLVDMQYGRDEEYDSARKR